jgi:RHS repeat-associated protein
VNPFAIAPTTSLLASRSIRRRVPPSPESSTCYSPATLRILGSNAYAGSPIRNVTKKYVVKPSCSGVDQVLAGRYSAAGTQFQNLVLVADRQGSTVAAVRPDGSEELSTLYPGRNAFGALEGASAGGATNTETGFTGASTPNQTGGFTYLRNRWYDPATGRFLTQDPIGLAGGINLYAYAGNDPVSYSDPDGLCPIPPSSCFGRQGADLAAGLTPGVSTIHDFATLVTGKNYATGEKVGAIGRAVAAVGLFTPATGGEIRAASEFLSAAEHATAREAGTSFEVIVRKVLGEDGASSAHLIERDAAGDAISKTHRVVDQEGNILHQHQTHLGQSGAERSFPAEWKQFQDVP